ncbi:MAG: twin-arginine translocase subunit TatC [Bacteroidetes bacterium]|nr:twin-arginine translocase subunit TatC [Bacteroidota bacterium]MCL6102813.1 twin-arginine translocase subunit TatC [Bacteroidota bacterium]
MADKEQRSLFSNKKNGSTSKGNEMSFLQHLEELRWHLVRASAAVLICGVVVFLNKKFIFDNVILAPRNPNFVTNRFFGWLAVQLNSPDLAINTKPFQLINIDLAGQFTIHLNLAIIGGIIISIPYILWEFWRFVRPALYENERKHVTAAVVYSSLLFLIGVSFGYFLIVPLTTHFFGSYQVSQEVLNQINLTSYISSVNTIVLGSGIVFELPIVMFFLSKVGLAGSSFFKKYRKHAFIMLLCLAAIITPPDAFSMLLVTGPLALLYELGILMAKMVEKKRKNIDLLEA